MLIAVAAASALMVAGTANATEDLAKANGCMNCHSADTKKVGPSYKEIAKKYKGQADAEKAVTAKLAEGKGHPAVKAKGDDLTKLVKWVLSQ
jgi:cytochrome c